MVLKINNRTENWKTARCLLPFFGDKAVLLARRLGEPRTTLCSEVKLELFWKGVRDWRAGSDDDACDGRLVESCRRRFREIREQVHAYGHFHPLRDDNYDICSDSLTTRLVNNLANTEIDIVLESPRRLYIGEAKYKSGFHADGRLVLVHQLIRQYVMAKVLVDVVGCGRDVVPFVVTEGSGALPHQLRFMIAQGWMEERNCLTWGELKAIASQGSGAGAEA